MGELGEFLRGSRFVELAVEPVSESPFREGEPEKKKTAPAATMRSTTPQTGTDPLPLSRALEEGLGLSKLDFIT
jgi:hypothetical protein